MLARLTAFLGAGIVGAAILVAPDRPADPVASPQVGAESAIALLGEAWDLAVPEIPSEAANPLLEPLPRPVVDPVPPEPGSAVALRKPIPRPEGLQPQAEVVAQTVAPPVATVRAGGDPRWIVRDRGTGAVLAELPLAEALALLQARSLAP
jgi:hypothetical protein